MKRLWGLLLFTSLLSGALLPGCLGAVSNRRNFFVLHSGEAEAAEGSAGPAAIDGACRVSDLDSEAAYQKFQFVIRKSPYELRYSDQNVWAARPNQMASDMLADVLQARRVFSSTARQLGDSAPKYTLSGVLQAVELYDSGNMWFAHVALRLYLSNFKDGARVWNFQYERRKPIQAQDFGQGARALSELLREAYDMAATSLVQKLGDPSRVPVLPKDQALLGGEALYLPGKAEEPASNPETDATQAPVYLDEKSPNDVRK